MILILNDNLAELRELYDEANEAYVNDATVEVTLLDAEGAEISGQSWPLVLSYVTGSNGLYRGVLEDALVLTDGQKVTAVVEATSGGGAKLRIDSPETARVRRP